MKGQNKFNATSLSISVTVFLFAQKLLSLLLWSLESFSLFLLTVLRKIKHNYMSGLFCIEDLSKVGRKKPFFFNFMVFNPVQAKMK